jgi:hypothetical protein
LTTTSGIVSVFCCSDTAQPGHLAGHRCCANHLADLAFDAPDLIAGPAHELDTA